jgi:hypothetical protein
MLFTTIETAIFPPLLSLPDRMHAVTENGFDEVIMDGDATAANDDSPDPMERPVSKHGNCDEQCHEEELLDE